MLLGKRQRATEAAWQLVQMVEADLERVARSLGQPAKDTFVHGFTHFLQGHVKLLASFLNTIHQPVISHQLIDFS